MCDREQSKSLVRSRAGRRLRPRRTAIRRSSPSCHAGVVRFDQARALLERNADLLAGSGVEGAGLLDEALAAASHGDEEHAVAVEPGKVGVGGEAAVEGEVAHCRAVAAEEVEELEDGAVGGFPAGAGVGPQVQAGVGILGEAGQQAVVHGADRSVGIGGEPSGLGQDVEAGEEARTAIHAPEVVAAVAARAGELEGEEGQHGRQRGPRARAREAGLRDRAVDTVPPHSGQQAEHAGGGLALEALVLEHVLDHALAGGARLFGVEPGPDVGHGEVALAQGDDALAEAWRGPHGGAPAGHGVAEEEGGGIVGLVEVAGHVVDGAEGVAEALGDLPGGTGVGARQALYG